MIIAGVFVIAVNVIIIKLISRLYEKLYGHSSWSDLAIFITGKPWPKAVRGGNGSTNTNTGATRVDRQDGD